MKRFSWFALLGSLFLVFTLPLAARAENAAPFTEPSAEEEKNLLLDAVQTLKGVAKVSDLTEAPQMDPKNRVYLKLENQQNIGAFKIRGAYFMMSRIPASQRAKGVATCSAGNHAQGVGFSADKFNIPATIFMPKSAPKKKIDAVKSYRNVRAVLVDGSFQDAKEACEKFVRETGAIYVPPYDDLNVIAGQGTVGWEIMQQLPQADVVLVPVGGGGLISGVALAVKQINPKCRVIGVQSVSSNAMALSLQQGKVVALDKVSTTADGTAVARPGDITFQLCRKYVDGIVTVTEDDIKNAIRVLYTRYHITAEGAGALGVAAVLSGRIGGENQNIVCVISGGNIDPDVLRSVVASGERERDLFQVVSTPGAPAAAGPYSQAVRCGDWLFLSGQIAMDPASGKLVGNDIKTQTEQVMKNLQAVLSAAGYDMSCVVKTTCFLADINDFAAFNEVYGRYLTGKPARSCIAASALPKNALVEVDVIACKKH
ncbi:MAG: pyridoxal-phosphate dependent enzyme [Victivallaceae bacterium]|nr:pyridoxal-phosphate dependent enzyme [Victivallaceae bacterium]